MCLSCGCCATGGSPTDDHGDDSNIVLRDLTDAANAQGITLAQAAQNIADSLATNAFPVETAVDVEPDAVLKALEVSANPQRFVLGIAFPSEKLDGHKEWMSRAEVENAAWNYVRKGRTVGFYHADATLGHAEIVESYIYRGPDWVTKDIEGAEQTIREGDWLLGAILDPPAFDLVLKGKADGWSLDGLARRRRAKPPAR